MHTQKATIHMQAHCVRYVLQEDSHPKEHTWNPSERVYRGAENGKGK